MTSLQTVVMGLVIVFLDIPPDGYDWIADPAGWVLVLLGLAPLAGRLPNQRGLVLAAWVCLLFSVLSWPAGSPATLTPLLGWLFSLPTLAWCFLVCDAVSDVVSGRLRWVALALRAAFAVVAPLPGLVYLGEQDWLSTPAEVLILVANLGVLLVLSSASSRPGLGEPAAAPRPESGRQKRSAAATPTPTQPTPTKPTRSEPTRSEPSGATPAGPGDGTPVTGAEVIAKVRRRRQARERGRGRADDQDAPKH